MPNNHFKVAYSYYKIEMLYCPFSESKLKECLKMYVYEPEITFAQSKLETGNYTSNIFEENNNLFGMKHPKQRPTLSIGINRGSAVYEKWQDSVLDLRLWQEYYIKKGYDISDYDTLLKRFNSNKNYRRIVNQLIK